MPTTKSGEVITWKEFFHRWKEGIAGITPAQALKASIQGTYITILGIILGIIASIINYKNTWWVVIILIGALIITIIQLIGMKQKLKVFKMIEGVGLKNGE